MTSWRLDASVAQPTTHPMPCALAGPHRRKLAQLQFVANNRRNRTGLDSRFQSDISRPRWTRVTATISTTTEPVSDPAIPFLIPLPDGYCMEMIHQAPAQDSQRAPLLLVHGSFHAAWCWQVHFMPFLAAAGYDCYAVSLRGQGGSERRKGMKASNLAQHAADLRHILSSLWGPAVLIGHSFGGLVVQRLLTGSSRAETEGRSEEQRPPLAGVALLCAAPSSGNDALVKRIAKKSLITAAKLTWSMVTKNFLKNATACRELFFSDDLPQAELDRYQRMLRDNASPVPVIEVSRMNEEVPLPAPPADHPPAFVLGAELDRIVDMPAIEETAALYDVAPVFLKKCAHDVMLDVRWQEAAEALRSWLDTL